MLRTWILPGIRQTYIIKLHDYICANGMLDGYTFFWGKHGRLPRERGLEHGAFFSNPSELAERDELKTAAILLTS
jgi:hypothetical protein